MKPIRKPKLIEASEIPVSSVSVPVIENGRVEELVVPMMAAAGINERPLGFAQDDEEACICDVPDCGCSSPSVAVCRECGGRVALRADYVAKEIAPEPVGAEGAESLEELERQPDVLEEPAPEPTVPVEQEAETDHQRAVKLLGVGGLIEIKARGFRVKSVITGQHARFGHGQTVEEAVEDLLNPKQLD